MKIEDDFILDGFSSEQELIKEQINVTEKKGTIDLEKEEVKFKIPPPQEIKSKSYSLKPDIMTGWTPKSDLPIPVPIVFDSKKIDCLVRKAIEKESKYITLCYLGPRFENTYYAWYDKPFDFPYPHIKGPKNMKFSNRPFCGQHWDTEHKVTFDSFYESGNLDCVFEVGQRQYDLFLRVDSNTRGHIQWYNFKMKNLQKLQKYKINICNFQKCSSLYTRGMKPYIHSLKRAEKQKKGWEQGGQFIRYEKKISKAAKILNLEQAPSYRLSFQFYTQYENDEIQVAYCIPYTYTHLKQFTNQLAVSKKEFVKVQELCTSLGGLDVPLLTIHDESSNKIPVKKGEIFTPFTKKCVVISGRAHPGQSNGSYMMEGFLKFLCGNSKQARQLRQNIVFKVVPMLNPDGVALGNYRTGLSGKDFNRQYRDPDKQIFPEVYCFKKLVTESRVAFGDNLMMFLDFHGHSIKKNVFMYGPQYPITEKYYYQSRIFPKLLGNLTEMFRYYSCVFKICYFKQTTARAIMMRKLMVHNSYTIQASNGCFYDHEKLKDVYFNADLWMKMGERLNLALFQYLQIILVTEKLKFQRVKQKRARNIGGRNTAAINENNRPKNEQKSFKMLVQEIKRAEEERDLHRVTDDELSEGSSDGEDQKDDLSPNKRKALHQIIKNKKFKISTNKPNPLSHQNHQQSQGDITPLNFMTQNDQQFHKLEKAQSNVEIQNEDKKKGREESQQMAKKTQKYFLQRSQKNQSYNLRAEKAKDKVTTKIINFSFVGTPKIKTSRPIQYLNRTVLNRRLFFDMYNKDKEKQKEEQKEFPEIREPNKHKVLDLSDQIYRKTYSNSLNQRRKKQSVEIRADSRGNQTPKKLVQRLEQYKYRRLVLDQYEI